MTKTLNKVLKLLNNQFNSNSLMRSTIDTVFYVSKNKKDIKELLSKEENDWKSPLYQINKGWIIDFIDDTVLLENFLYNAIYTNIYSRVDSLVERIFSQEFKFKSNKALNRFLMADYYDEKRIAELEFENKHKSFNPTIFNYLYLLKPPPCVYSYLGLIRRIDLKDESFKDSFERDELIEQMINHVYPRAELPSLVKQWYDFELSRQNYSQEHRLLEITDLISLVDDFNGAFRRIRNNMVHTKHQLFEITDIQPDDIVQICDFAELIQYSFIWNLAIHSYPDLIEILDYDWESMAE